MRAPLVASLLACLSLSGVCTPARAQDNSATVQALFDEGKKLESAGNYAEACPKFLSSYTLEHRVGTLLNLADCYEKTGQTASAWARFVEARTLALRAGQNERADFAKEHADALEPKLSRLTIAVPHPAAGLQVTRDGVAVDAGMFGTASPVDPGDHVVEASAPGKTAWKGRVHVAGNAAKASIEVPALQDAPVAPAAATPTAPGAPGAPARAVDQSAGLGGRKVVALVLGGAGVAAAGVGAVFGVMALGKKSDSNQYCGADGNANDCYPPGASLRHDAAVYGNVSTALIGAGAALAVGGIVLWLLPSSSTAASAALSSDGRSLWLAGSF